MKLIAENRKESYIVDGLCALLCDLGIAADGYRQEEAIAVTFFSAEDHCTNEILDFMTPEEQVEFLLSVEDTVRSAMLKAGNRAIHRALAHVRAGHAHPDRHLG